MIRFKLSISNFSFLIWVKRIFFCEKKKENYSQLIMMMMRMNGISFNFISFFDIIIDDIRMNKIIRNRKKYSQDPFTINSLNSNPKVDVCVNVWKKIFWFFLSTKFYNSTNTNLIIIMIGCGSSDDNNNCTSDKCLLNNQLTNQPTNLSC